MMTISTTHEHGSDKVYYRVETRKDWQEAYKLIRYKANVKTLSYIIHNGLIYHCIPWGEGIYEHAQNAPYDEKHSRWAIAQSTRRLYIYNKMGL